MVIAVAVLAVVAATLLLWVIVPLVRGERRGDALDSPSEREAGARKRAALEAIVDLEEERELGKLSEADFAALRNRYESEALAALRELDAAGAPHSAEDPLEREIAELRASLNCPRCGQLRDAEGTCSQCDG